jgi:hypothetical protein
MMETQSVCTEFRSLAQAFSSIEVAVYVSDEVGVVDAETVMDNQ